MSHDVTWSRRDSFCEGQYEELSQPEELPTAPVRTQILQLPKPTTDISFAKFDFDEEDLEKLDLGTIIEVEFDGGFMETFPEQISQPYSITARNRRPPLQMETGGR